MTTINLEYELNEYQEKELQRVGEVTIPVVTLVTVTREK